jgi:hypothetical protein
MERPAFARQDEGHMESDVEDDDVEQTVMTEADVHYELWRCDKHMLACMCTHMCTHTYVYTYMHTYVCFAFTPCSSGIPELTCSVLV